MTRAVDRTRCQVKKLVVLLPGTLMGEGVTFDSMPANSQCHQLSHSIAFIRCEQDDAEQLIRKGSEAVWV